MVMVESLYAESSDNESSDRLSIHIESIVELPFLSEFSIVSSCDESCIRFGRFLIMFESLGMSIRAESRCAIAAESRV